ncbi:unannotated protein [freshwater metagenome]|uniref:Unannotated protein n=1 Tax=freshwater metagenome TaxID=449393 RepID=A0A6J7EZH3_9ZZZZ|nr:MFS transporter [Actinomycetota bacterium]
MSSIELIQKKSIRTLSSVQVLSGIGTAGTFAAGSLLVSSITNSETLAGLSQTFGVLGAAAMAIPLAKLTEKGGRRLGLALGYGLGSIGGISAIMGGVHRNIFLMLLGTFLVGAASASGYQARFAATDLALPENRSRNLSFVVWGSTVGAVAGPNLMEPAGNLAEHFSLPRLVGPYMVAAFMLAAASTVITIFLRPDPYLTALKLQHLNSTKVKRHTARKTLHLVSKNPRALLGIIAIAIGHVAMVSVMVMTPVHMAHVDVTLTIIGLVISIHVAGMYALSPVVGYLSDKWGRVTVIRIGGIILLASTLIAGLSHADNVATMGLGLFLLGLGWSCTLIAGSTLLSESLTEDLRPSAQGASDLLMNLTGALGGALAGVVIATLGYGWLCFFAAIPVSILVVLTFRRFKVSE